MVIFEWVLGILLASVPLSALAKHWRWRGVGWHRRPTMEPTLKGGLVVSWCGMRGIVTLVSALALPNGKEGVVFPFRDLIVFVAFCVVLGTLLIQGLTLRSLLLRLNLRDDDPVGREVTRASGRLSSRARNVGWRGLAPCRGAPRRVGGGACAIACPRRRSGGRAGRRPAHASVGAARQAILAMRKSGEIGDVAFRGLEEEMDRIELSAT
jgi:monovalent cation/hydrogen antiporter